MEGIKVREGYSLFLRFFLVGSKLYFLILFRGGVIRSRVRWVGESWGFILDCLLYLLNFYK